MEHRVSDHLVYFKTKDYLILTYVDEINCHINDIPSNIDLYPNFDLGTLKSLLNYDDTPILWFIGQTQYLSEAIDYVKDTKSIMSKYQ